MNANPPSFKSRWQRAIGESDLKPTTRLILQSISIHFMDENGGHCFPSIPDIMRVTGLTRKYVVRHLALATDKGWLERWHFGRGRANRRRNYQAVIPDVESRFDDMVQNLNQHHDDLVTLGHQLPPEIVSLGNHQPPEIVSLGNHKPCRDLTMQRESNHARGRARATESTASASETAPTLSVKEKNPMTKLTDELVERAKKTVRQRGIREDLSDTAISHSIAKCQAQKGYLEMTEAAWIETVVQWIGKERNENRSTTRFEPSSSQSGVEVSPEEKARNNAAYEARMALIDSEREKSRLLLLEQRGIDPKTGTKASSNPVDAIKALAAKVNVKPSTAPPARTFGPMGFIPGNRPSDAPKVQPLPEAPRAALNGLVMDVHRAGLPLPNVPALQDEIREAGENWPAVIERYLKTLARRREAAA